jgi:hypothetical protein
VKRIQAVTVIGVDFSKKEIDSGTFDITFDSGPLIRFDKCAQVAG